MRCSRCAALLLTLLAATPAQGQDLGELPASLTSDRPGFANTTAVAARLRLTAEAGIGVTIEDVPVGIAPNLALRTGLFDWLEARVRVPGAVGVFEDPDPRFGIADPWVGFKIGGLLADSLSASSVFEVSIPIGTDGFRAPEAAWRADVQLEWRFWGPLSLTPNGVASVRAELDPSTGETVRAFEGGGSLKLSWQILEVLGVFVQGYVLASERRDVRIAVGAGLAWRIVPNVQVDASFDIGVTDPGLPVITNQPIPPTVAAGTSILF